MVAINGINPSRAVHLIVIYAFDLGKISQSVKATSLICLLFSSPHLAIKAV
jgi:hypothetical protein